jgi:hypothetical protein
VETFWRFGPWLGRLILLVVAVLFTVLAWPALVDPVRVATAHGVSIGSAEALSRVRIGFGAIPLASAIIAFLCLVWPDRVLTGLYFVLIWVGVITVVSIIGVATNGPNDFDLRVLRVSFRVHRDLAFTPNEPELIPTERSGNTLAIR